MSLTLPKKVLKENPFYILLIFALFAFIAQFAGWNAKVIFTLSALGIIPLAQVIGEATEDLAAYVGPRLGGLINATLGNAAELIITIFAVARGLTTLVKASITGSILGNLLLVLGFSMLAGGIKNGTQKFDRRHVSTSAIIAVLAVISLGIPSMTKDHFASPHRIEILSIGVAAVMLVLYALFLLFSHQNSPIQPETHSEPKHSLKSDVIVLTLATITVAVLSEMLVGTVEEVVSEFGISEFFIGIILIPIIGNVAEHLVAVQQALRNSMDLSVEIAVASSIQIAMFVAPLLVFIGLLLGHPLTLVFQPLEIMALASAVITMALVSMDGESNWLEGAELLAVYLILAIAFFLM